MNRKQLIAAKISQAIKEQRISKGQLATIMSVQPSIVTRWLKGNHNFTTKTLFQIEEKLGIQLILVH